MHSYPMSPLQGQMMDEPLLISGILEFAARHYGDTEIVSRRVEGDLFGSIGTGLALDALRKFG